MTEWYYSDDARNRFGPCSAEEMRAHYRLRRLRRDSLVWRTGMTGWVALERVAAELELDSIEPDSTLPPPLPPTAGAPPAMRAPAPRPAVAPRKGMSGCMIALLICAGLSMPMVAILAAIAIPAYQDYTVRAKVSAVLMQATALKPVIEEQYQREGSCPGDGNTGLAPVLQHMTQSPYIATVRVGTLDEGNCAFEVTLQGIGPAADGKTILFEARHNGDQLAWDCSGGDLPARHRPRQCRAQ